MNHEALTTVITLLLFFVCSTSSAKTSMAKEGETVYTADGKAHFFSTDNHVYVDEGNGKYGKYQWKWASGNSSCKDCTTLDSTKVEMGDVKGLRKAQQPRKPTIKKNVKKKTSQPAVKKTSKPITKRAAVRKPASKKKAPVKIEMKRQVTGREVKLSPQRQQALSKAVKTAIPQNTKINTVVTAVIRPNRSKPSVVVSHLMDGESPDDVDSTVRPEYNTIPKLSRYSQKRAYDIIKSILKKVDTKGVSELVVEVNHGVRETRYKVDLETKKRVPFYLQKAKTIYSTSISFDKIPKYKWQSMGQSALIQNWKVEHNRIPFLTISGRDD